MALMTPDDFVKLREYSNYSRCKLKDAITDLASATLSQDALKAVADAESGEDGKAMPQALLASEDLTYAQFCDFLRFYLTADVGDDVTSRLFGSLKRTMNRRRSLAKDHLRKASVTGRAVKGMSVVLRQKAEEVSVLCSPDVSPAVDRDVKRKLKKRESSKTALLAAAMGATAALHAVGTESSDVGTSSPSVSSEKGQQEPSKGAGTSGSSSSAGSPAQNTTVSLQDVVCFLCLLESGSPADKLGLLFKLYDLDNSGYLESQELGCILDQMMTVSRCLGWDTTELRPMLEEMLQELDLNEDGRISKEEWMESGKSTVPLLVLLGVETNLQEGGHKWRLKRFKSSVHCNLCRSYLLYKQGFICNLCNLTVHERCVIRLSQTCVRSYVKSRRANEVMSHHWVEGNCSGKCSHCKKTLKHKTTLCGLTCCWCHRMLHNGCEAALSPECDFGELQVHIVPPTCIRPSTLKGDAQGGAAASSLAIPKHPNVMSEEGFRLQISTLPEHVRPMAVFVNPKSGGKQGAKVLRKLQYLLNPRQVFDLTKGGPVPGLQFIGSLPNSRVLCCGGDGTVGWILSALDGLQYETMPPVSVLPLGTGNDLARCLKWGGGYDGERLDKILQQMAEAETVQLDRWRIEVKNLPGVTEEGDRVPYNVMNNYFSIGVDASIAHKFHVMREKRPEKFNSRVRNKLWYFEIASHENFAASCKDLPDKLSVECDGKTLELGQWSLEGIAILNIPSIYGGTALWGSDANCPSLPSQREGAEARSRSPEHKPQAMDDKLLEVAGVQGALHMGQIKMGFKQSGIRLAQCSTLSIRTNSMLPMQIDGEPWMQPPCEITISHLNQMPMMQQRPKPTQLDRPKSRLRAFFGRSKLA